MESPKSSAVLSGTGTIIGGTPGSATNGLVKAAPGVVYAVNVGGTGGVMTVHLHDDDTGTGTGTTIAVAGAAAGWEFADEFQSVWDFDNTNGTADAAVTAWRNPLQEPVIADVTVVVTSAGTGTIDIGVSSDATGSANDILEGGTLAVGAYWAIDLVAVSNLGGQYLIQGRGTAGDSIVAKTDEVTAVTGKVIIRYRKIS
jgi:hypothetical protein